MGYLLWNAIPTSLSAATSSGMSTELRNAKDATARLKESTAALRNQTAQRRSQVVRAEQPHDVSNSGGSASSSAPGTTRRQSPRTAASSATTSPRPAARGHDNSKHPFHRRQGTFYGAYTVDEAIEGKRRQEDMVQMKKDKK